MLVNSTVLTQPVRWELRGFILRFESSYLFCSITDEILQVLVKTGKIIVGVTTFDVLIIHNVTCNCISLLRYHSISVYLSKYRVLLVTSLHFRVTCNVYLIFYFSSSNILSTKSLSPDVRTSFASSVN